MSKAMIALGSLLTALGLIGYAASGAASVTALIPTFFGLPILACGWASRQSPRARVWGLIGALLATVGLLGSLRGLTGLPALLSGGDVARPMAVAVQSIMALLCLGFLVPIVRGVLRAGGARG